MAEPQDGQHARTPAPGQQHGHGHGHDDGPDQEQNPAAIRQDIAETRAQMSETIDAIEQELNPEQLRHEAAAMLREEATERVDRLIGEVTLRANLAGTRAAEVARQVSREARTRVDAVRERVTGGTPTATGRQTRQELQTAATRLRQWAREEPAQLAAAAAVVVTSVVIIARAPRNPTEARIRALQRRARG